MNAPTDNRREKLNALLGMGADDLNLFSDGAYSEISDREVLESESRDSFVVALREAVPVARYAREVPLKRVLAALAEHKPTNDTRFCLKTSF